MEVVLLEQVSGLGSIGEIVDVKNGYGRNFLVPQGKALRATEANKKDIEARKAQLEAQNDERKAEAQKQHGKIDDVVATIVRQASEDGKLYGSVAVRDIAAALKEDGHEVDARQIDLQEPIKSLGLYKVTVNLHAEVQAVVRVHVARNADSPIPEELIEEVVEEAPVVEAAPEEEASESAEADAPEASEEEVA